MIGVIVGVVVVVAVAAVVYALVRRSQQQQAPNRLRAENAAADERASVQGLRLGDVVNYEGREYVVQGTIRYEQGGSVWHDHLLVDGTAKKWLSVEDDEGLEVAVWEKLVDPDLQPGEKRLLYGGHNYVLEEQGHARYAARGTTGTTPAGDYDYIDYEADDLRLSFERYAADAPWELSVGRVIPEAALDIFPGEGPVS